MKYFKKKNEKTLVLKYPQIRSYVSTIPWSTKKKIVSNKPVLYTRHYGIRFWPPVQMQKYAFLSAQFADKVLFFLLSYYVVG